MAQFVLPVVGAAIGFVVGGPSGAQLGFAAGSVGNAVLGVGGQDSQGPRLDDLKAPKANYGAVIPYVEGHPRLPAIIAWQSDKREVENTQGGKGGPEQTTFTYVVDLLIVLAENDIGELRRVWLNGKLVWSNASDSTPESIDASGEAPWSGITLYDGNPSQMPPATYEAAIGTADAPAYRDRTTVLITDLNLGTSGQIPVLTFECGGTGTGSDIAPNLAFNPKYQVNMEDSIPVPADYVITVGATVYDDIPENYGLFGYELVTGNYVRCTDSVGTTDSTTTIYDIQKIINGTQPPPTNFVVNYLFSIGNVKGKTGSSIGLSDVFTCFQLQDGLLSANGIGIGLRRNGPFNELYWVRRFDGGTSDAGFVGNIIPDSYLYFRLEQTFVTGYTLSSKLFIRPTEVLVNETQIAFNNGAQYRYAFLGNATGFPLNPSSSLPGITSFDFGRFAVYIGQPPSGVGAPLSRPTLQEVVERQCERAGIPAEYVDASDLATKFVSGMALTQLVSPRNVIDTLTRGYFFSAVESEVLRFKFLGGAVVETLPYDVLGASTSDPEFDALPITYTSDIERPVQLFIKYINNNDDYQDGNEQSFRLTNTPGNTASQELPLVFTPTEAKQIADVTVQLGKVSSVRFGPLALSRDYAYLEPTDPVLLTDRDGNTYRARMTSKNEVDGVLTFEALLDDASIITSDGATAGGYNNSTVVNAIADTEFEILDIPLLRDVDDVTGIYWAVGGVEGWPGATWNQSSDDSTFVRVADTERNSIIGVATTTLANFTGGRFFDEVNVVRVNVGTRQLSSYSRDQVLDQGAGSYLIGDEVLQARNATFVSEGVYDLSGLLRGLRGTEWAIAGHGSNERVVLLDVATTNRQALNVSDILSTIYWKAVTFGRAASTATSESIQFNAVSQKPFAPVDLRGIRDTPDLLITWERRTRLSTNFYNEAYPLGEASESYRVRIFSDSGYTTLIRTVTVEDKYFVYSDDEQALDFGSPIPPVVYVEVAQLSATAGAGYVVRGAL